MDNRFSRHRPGKLDEQADKTGREAIEEARMVLPGIQALFGFQLIAVFNERFKELAEDEQLIHFSATVLVTIAIGLIMTPAAYHRLAEQTTIGHLEKYPFRAACKSDSKNLFEFDHRERVRWGNWVSLI
jgi:hypothetical protein